MTDMLFIITNEDYRLTHFKGHISSWVWDHWYSSFTPVNHKYLTCPPSHMGYSW